MELERFKKWNTVADSGCEEECEMVKEFESLIVEQKCVGISAKKSRKSGKIKKMQCFSSSDNFLLPLRATDQKPQSQKS